MAKVSGAEIIREMSLYHNCLKAIPNRGGESAFQMELYIAVQRYNTAVRLSETRHVLIEKDFTSKA